MLWKTVLHPLPLNSSPILPSRRDTYVSVSPLDLTRDDDDDEEEKNDNKHSGDESSYHSSNDDGDSNNGDDDSIDIRNIPNMIYSKLGMKIVNHDGGRNILNDFI